jgi:hypothetical protein
MNRGAASIALSSRIGGVGGITRLGIIIVLIGYHLSLHDEGI